MADERRERRIAEREERKRKRKEKAAKERKSWLQKYVGGRGTTKTTGQLYKDKE